MNEHDRVRPKLEPPRGVLHTGLESAAPGYGRFWPASDLAPFVEHFWTVVWEVSEPGAREVLPHPSVHLVLEAGASRVAGVPRGRFTRTLAGRGRVLGTKFRPGGFHPFLSGSVTRITARTVGLDELFGALADGLEREALAEQEPLRAFERVQEFLRALRPKADPLVDTVAAIAARAAEDREIVRVDQLAAAFGLGVRRLERLFREYVGVSPKWVIQRYRLHEAAERLAADPTLDGATLAHDLGYADQAHFVRDFKRWVGRTPADYARHLGEDRQEKAFRGPT